MLLASLVKEEKKENEDLQERLCQDRVGRMETRALQVPRDPLGSQDTQMALWNVSLDHLVIRGLLGVQGSRD